MLKKTTISFYFLMFGEGPRKLQDLEPRTPLSGQLGPELEGGLGRAREAEGRQAVLAVGLRAWGPPVPGLWNWKRMDDTPIPT